MSSGWERDNFTINSMSLNHPCPHFATKRIERHRNEVRLAIWRQRHETWDTDMANFMRSEGEIGPASNMAESISSGRDATREQWCNAMPNLLRTKFNTCRNGRERQYIPIENDVERRKEYSLLNTVTGQRCGSTVQSPVITFVSRLSWGYKDSKGDITPFLWVNYTSAGQDFMYN